MSIPFSQRGRALFFVGVVLPKSLGRCGFCMRAAFVMALGASVLAAVSAVTLPGWIAIAISGLALLLAALWLAHLAAFAFRNAGGDESRAGGTDNENFGAIARRRQFLAGFAKGFAFAALATAVPTASAFAQSKIQLCLSCCSAQLSNCGTSGKCQTEYQNCVASCNSGGETPADWSCW